MRLGTSAAAVGILLLLGGGTAPGASQYHRESLRGLAGVAPRVERIDQDAQLYGLDEMSIYADVEQRLSKAGIKVLTAGQLSQEAGAPVLYIRVNAKLSFDAPVYAVHVTVSLLQDAVAVRDSNLKLREVKTWDAGYMRTYDPASLAKARSVVSDLVDEFIREWIAANPKK
jgi:hypothetical protein